MRLSGPLSRPTTFFRVCRKELDWSYEPCVKESTNPIRNPNPVHSIIDLGGRSTRDRWILRHNLHKYRKPPSIVTWLAWRYVKADGTHSNQCFQRFNAQTLDKSTIPRDKESVKEFTIASQKFRKQEAIFVAQKLVPFLIKFLLQIAL
jgi:hypothetical protein